jgi:hypothetical protein
MARPWLIIRVLVAGALFFPGYCSASGSNDAILYNELTDCIDLQFERSPAPDSFSEIDLAADCPELLLSLADSVWVNKTSLANHDHPSLAQLADLRYFLLGTFSQPESGRTLDFSRLESILAETLDTDDHDQGQSWWERLLSWLRQRHKDRDDVDLRWLDAWLEKLSFSETTAEIVTYSVAALLLLLAIGLVINEVRLARQGRSAFRPHRTVHSGPTGAAPVAAATPPDAQQLPGKLPELLNVCIDYLIRNQRLPEARSSTNREFLHHLLHRGDNAASGFDQLLQQAECVLYGDRHIDAQTLRQCRQQAAALLGASGDSCPAPATPG